MHFIRKINKNVQESFSIINEGIQITNGILEIKSVHLPTLLQLSAKGTLGEEESPICCIFEDCVAERNRGVGTNQSNSKESGESHEPRVNKGLVSKLKFLHGENAGLEPGHRGNNVASVESSCSLGENCLLKRFSLSSFKQSIEFVDAFLKTLSRVLENQNVTSRKVVENQSFLILYEISQLYEVPLALKSQNDKLDKLLGDKEDVQSSLLSIVALALKLLNEILVYPVHIYFGNLNRGYDDSKIERRKYDSFVKKRYPEESIDEYDLVGSFSFININEEEKKDLDEYLYYIDSILDVSGNSNPVLESLAVTYDESDSDWNEVFYGFLTLFRKIFAYNDLNWHISQQDSNVFCFWNRYFDACSHYVYHEELCYDCTKPKMDADLSVNEDYCVCFLRTERCNFRVKIVAEKMIKNDVSFVKQLFGMLRSVKQKYIKSTLLGLTSQLMSQIEGFVEVFGKHAAADSVFEILESCNKDHFYLLDTTLKAVSYEEHNPSVFLSLVSEKDMKIFMSFPPCTIEAVMVIHAYVVSSKWHVSRKNSEALVNYLKNMVLVYTYYNCTHEATKSMEILSVFSQVLHIVLESVLFAQVCVRDLPLKSELFCRHILEKLSSWNAGMDTEALAERFDVELFNMVIFGLVVLLNLSKLGVFVEYQIIRSFSNYLCFYMSVINSGCAGFALERMSTLSVNKLPEIYKCMLSVLYTKETQGNEELDQVIKMKMEILMDFESLPIFQLAVSLLDPYINARLTSKFTEEVFKLACKMGLFSLEHNLGRRLKEYFTTKCEELSSVLNEDFDDGRLAFYRKFVFNYTSLLSLNKLNERSSSKVGFLEEYGLKFVLNKLSKIVSILRVKSGGNLESILLYILKLLVCYVMEVEEVVEFKGLDFSPLFELVSMERNCGVHSKGLASVVLLYLFIVGFGPDETLVFGSRGYGSLAMLSRMHEELNRVYFSREFNSAQIALKLDDMGPVDSLGLGYESSLKRFKSCISSTNKSDLIELFYWNRNNFFNFSLPPSVYKKLIAFKLYLHPHLVGAISRCVSVFDEKVLTHDTTEGEPQQSTKLDDVDDNRLLLSRIGGIDADQSENKHNEVDNTNVDKSAEVSVYDIKSTEEFVDGMGSEGVSDKVLNEPMTLMKNLYKGELEFAKDKLRNMESQLHILANSLHLSHMTNQNMRNRIKLLEKQIQPSNEDKLDVELERERQRYCHLEQMYNRLLIHLNEIGLNNTKTN